MDSSRIVRVGVQGVCAFLAVIAGWAGGALAQPVPESDAWIQAFTQSGPVQTTFGGQGSGVINGYSGQTVVYGWGSLSNADHDVCNDSVKSWAELHVQGQIVNAEGGWTLFADCEVKLEPQAIYVATTPAVLEHYRVDCHAVLEIRGDFNAVVANKRSIDTYTTPGVVNYDATGGGTPPATYVGVGVDNVVRGPGPSSGNVTNPGKCEISYFGDVESNVVSFKLYVSGSQYMMNNKEEDVNLFTGVGTTPTPAQPNPTGWNGMLVSWIWWNGQQEMLNFWTFG